MLNGFSNKDGRALKRLAPNIQTAAQLKSQWRMLAREYLRYAEKGSTWRFSRPLRDSDPRQGWKIHVSGTVLSACDVFETVAPYLRKIGVAFKAPSTLEDLIRINTGLFKGYSQVGKFITIYPRNDDEFRKVIFALYRRIPGKPAAPAVPFEFRYKNSNIYFRYGAFIHSSDRPGMLEAPAGHFVPDRRDVPCPEWVIPPIECDGAVPSLSSPLSTRYQVFRALSQRGKGGVYEAIDTQSLFVRHVILKEGRRGGETDWSGLDGAGKIIREAEALKSLRMASVLVPEPLDGFEIDRHQYLVLEKLDGKTLHEFLSGRKRRLRMSVALNICKQLAAVVDRIHKAGWIWRDCKPANFIISNDKTIRPIDFEGACRDGEFVNHFWFSPNFSAPEVLGHIEDSQLNANVAADLFSLGVTLYFVIEGKLPPKILARHDTKHECSTINIKKCKCSRTTFSRRSVPNKVKGMIRELLSDDPAQRPSATLVTAPFTSDQLHLS